MIDKLKEIIKYDSESAVLDFKSQEYPLGNHAKKNEILKDLSSMANHPSNDTKFIIIGVEEKNGMASDFIDLAHLTDQAKYQQFVEEYIEPKINFKYLSFEYEGHKLAAFIISGNHDRPYLFKKEPQKNSDRIQEFRIGEGFIRSGTSTRKLTRKDFDDIYSKRYETKDRSPDLKITPILFPYLQDMQSPFSLFIIDFSIENLSSKSISYNAEFRIYYNADICVFKKFEFEDKFKNKGLAGIYPQYFIPPVDLTSFDLQIEKQSDSFKVSRLKRLNQDYAITISQNDLNDSIFLGEILLSYLPPKIDNCKVSIELTLRSDDFLAGPLVKKYELDFKNEIFV